MEASAMATRLELLDPTHRGLHRFVPRHRDEILVDIGDPVYVHIEAEDGWCEGTEAGNIFGIVNRSNCVVTARFHIKSTRISTNINKNFRNKLEDWR